MPTSVCNHEGCEAALEYKTSPRKWCDAHKPPKKHGVGYSLSTFCTMPECGRPHQARGYCKMHYKRFVNRSDKTIKQCDACGSDCLKEGRQRYQRVYCSELCRQYDQRGPWSKPLPADHMALNCGATCEWSAPEIDSPEIKPRLFFCGTCGECGALIVERAYGVPSTWCSKSCERRVMKRKRRAAEYNAAGWFTYTDVMRQYQRQGMVCAYCKQKPAGLPEPEHVVPISRGGDNAMTNIVAACHSCNSNKGDLTPDEWRAYRTQRGLPEVDTTLVGDAFSHLIIRLPNRPSYRIIAA